MASLKTVIITGANSGLGYETARKVAAAGPDYAVVLACRNVQKAEAAANHIRAEIGNTHLTVQELDLASLQSVRSFASFYTDGSASGQIYCLVCNAGISSAHTGETADGFDLVFQTNYLSNFLLINLLLPCMQPDGKILVVSSDMHNPPGGLEWKSPLLLAHDTSRQRYSYSKLCDLYLVYALARRLKEHGSQIRVDAFNPGFMQTGFAPVNPAHAAMVKETMPDRVGDLGRSSDALAELVTSSTLPSASGLYYDRSTQAVPSSTLSYSTKNAEELWQASIKFTGLEP